MVREGIHCQAGLVADAAKLNDIRCHNRSCDDGRGSSTGTYARIVVVACRGQIMRGAGPAAESPVDQVREPDPNIFQLRRMGL
jgi:hypothetical protein